MGRKKNLKYLFERVISSLLNLKIKFDFVKEEEGNKIILLWNNSKIMYCWNVILREYLMDGNGFMIYFLV